MLLQTLGSIRLTRTDGSELDEVLRQPKRLALLAYLSSPRPGVWHRRDVLLAAFWPGLDTAHARTALRNALYVLRQHLDDGVIRTRGDEEVSIDPSLLMTDAALLEADVAAGRFGDALARYEGDALPGLHVGEAEGFENWLQEERLRTRILARNAGLGMAAACEESGDFAGAAEALSRVLKLDPIDESVVRRLIMALERAGHRARALDVYERFRARLAEEFDAEPSAETVRLVDVVRSRRVPAREPLQPHSPAAAAADASVGLADVVVRAPVETPTEASGLTSKPRRTRRIAALSTALVVAAAVVAAGLTRQFYPTSRPQTLLVLPMKNATDRADLAYLATGIDDEIVTRLRGIGGLETTQSANWALRDSTPVDLPRIGNEFGARVAFDGRLSQESDSFVVTGYVVDIASGTRSDIGRHAFLVDQARDVSSRVSAAIAGVIFRAPLTEMPRGRSDRIDAESFRLTMQGWHDLLSEGVASRAMAQQSFEEAIRRDATNARAWAGLSSFWANAVTVGNVPFDEGIEQSERAASRALELDSLEGSAWLNLAAMRAYKTHSMRVVEPLIAKAIAVDPANPEIQQVKSALYRHAWAWNEARDAVRFARRLDPMRAGLVDREAIIGLCSNKPSEALELYRSLVTISPRGALGHRGVARSLARLGKWDEAVAELRIAWPPKTARDSALRDTLARGKRGYWQLIHAEGKPRLDETLALVRVGKWVAPMRIASDRLAAGEIDAGLDDMAKAAAKGDIAVYRAVCQMDMDEARSSPRFWTILESLPKWDLARPVPRP
jgi:DNA-binding SARP family transcriptional activator/TolB-like protein